MGLTDGRGVTSMGASRTRSYVGVVGNRRTGGPRGPRGWRGAVLCGACLVGLAGAAAEPPPALVPASPRRAYFAEEEVTFRFGAGAGLPAGLTRVTAELFYAERTLRRQELPLALPVEFTWRLPSAKPGAVLDLELVVTASGAGGARARYAQPLSLYGRPQTAARQAALAAVKVTVYAPGDERLAAALRQAGIPFTRVDRLRDLDSRWLLASHLDFAAQPGLSNELLALAGQGTSVLVLPPFTGVVPLPRPPLTAMAFAGPARLRELDPRADLAAWSPAGPLSVAGAALHPLGEGVGLQLAADGPWPWVSLQVGAGQVIFCGFDWVTHAAGHPTPVALLLTLLLAG